MNKEQFISLLRTPSTINLNLVKGLEEITERFPYFQNAHLLLAKQYQGHENIRYESYLRKAAAYASDRRVLYQLIKLEPAEVIHMQRDQPVPDFQPGKEQQQSIIPDTEAIVTHADVKEDEVTATAIPESEHTEIPEITEVIEEEKIPIAPESVIIPTPVSEAKTTSDTYEVIAKRLQEISKSKAAASKPVAETDKQTGAIPAPDKPTPDQPAEKVRRPRSEDKNLHKQVQDPVSPKVEPVKTEEHHTFLDWLKIKDIPVLPAERSQEYFKSKFPGEPGPDETPSNEENKIIDHFIKSDPRIVPAKSEFYSPGNMARQSALEHGDLISETLARIYAQQGNIVKAIDAYRRLSLKLPEKSSYFAALIKELEEKEQS